MARFPALEVLAESSLDEVLHYWSGLGYYARAGNLHKTARIIMQAHSGQLPADFHRLLALPGIGRSTAGAILSMAFGIRAPILDGNVKRVLSRHEGIEGWPGEARIATQLWAIAERYTPTLRVGAYTQAMMDLGATLCTRKLPACPRCPLQNTCKAFKHDLTALIPGVKPSRMIPTRKSYLLALQDPNDRFYLEKRPPQGVWGSLWSFPEFGSEVELLAWCAAQGIAIGKLERLPLRRHTFTHFHLDYQIVLAKKVERTGRLEESGRSVWHQPGEKNALPTPVRRLLDDWAGESNNSSQKQHQNRDTSSCLKNRSQP
jgi:A/G-specific adenine glycosylase